MGSMPNRREANTVKIVLHVLKKFDGKHLCILVSVLYDWSVLCVFDKFILSEWAQSALGKK